MGNRSRTRPHLSNLASRSNTAADHIEAAKLALAQLPKKYRRGRKTLKTGAAGDRGTRGTGLRFQWQLIQRSFGVTYKIYSLSARQIMTPYHGNGLGEVVVLEPNSNVDKVWWSIGDL